MVRVKPRGRQPLEDDSDEGDGFDDDFGIYGLMGDEQPAAAAAAAALGGRAGGRKVYAEGDANTEDVDMQDFQNPPMQQEQQQQQDLDHHSLLLQQEEQHQQQEEALQQQRQDEEEEQQQLQVPVQPQSHHTNLGWGLLSHDSERAAKAAAAAAAEPVGRKRSRKQSRPHSAAVDEDPDFDPDEAAEAAAAAAAAAGAGSGRRRRGAAVHERPAKRTRGVAGVIYDEGVFDWASEEDDTEEEPAARLEVQHNVLDNESHCHACGSDSDQGLLLCCEACPFVYHTYCLRPPLEGVPAGAWYCPVCEGAEALLDEAGGLDRILAVRKAAASAAAAAAADEVEGQANKQQPQQQDEPANEFFVKWKERSYIHCAWISNEVMQRSAGIKHIGAANPVSVRLRKFWRGQAEAAANGDLREAEERGQLVNGINPAWMQVDRVLAERVGNTRQSSRLRQRLVAAGLCSGEERSGVEYLVSWKELPLDQATWEAQEDLADFAAEIGAFSRSHTPIAADAAARKKLLKQQQQEQKRQQQEQEQDAAAPLLNGSTPADESAAAAAPAAATAAADAASDKGKGSRKWETTPDFVSGGELHPYQLEGLNWLYHKAQVKDHVILADEMGLGKTIQAIAYLGALWQDCVALPHLLVVPLSVLPNWERELSIWAPYLTVVSLKGNAASRQLLLEHCLYAPAGTGRKSSLQERVKFHVLLTTYEMLSKHLTDIKRLHWSALVVDEAHRLKSATSKLFQDLVRVDARHRVLLTGTPLQNSLEELFYLMNFLEPLKFSNVEEFKAAYAALDDRDKVSELHRQLAPHMLRRLKKDVLRQLPPKMEQMVRVELSDEQRELYKAILGKNYDSLVATDRSRATVRLRNVMMELRKVVNHPSLLGLDLDTPAYKQAVETRKAQAAAALRAREAKQQQNGSSTAGSSDALEQLVAASGKLALLDRMMQKLVAGGHRVLIYSQFTRTLDILEDWLAGRGWGYERIDGDVAGAVRQARVDSFNARDSRKVAFLLSTRAGGVGINLATADTVVIYDSDWNPHNDLQALARAHRMGQQRGVMVLRLVTRSTIEERMLQRAKSKMVLEHLVVAKAARADKLEQATLDDILRYGAQELFAEDTDTPAAAAAAAAAGPDGQQPAGQTVTQQQQQQQRKLRIVWDDDALDRLLDRSQLDTLDEAAAEAEEEEDDFSKAFKVANFDMVAAAEPEQQQQQQQDSQRVADPTASQQQFWGSLLKDHKPTPEPAAATAAAAAGGSNAAAMASGGGRRRRAAKVSYVDAVEGLDEWASLSSSSGGSDSDGGSDGDDDRGRSAKKRKAQDDDEAWELPAEQMQEESEELLDDAEKDEELAAAEAQAAAAAAKAAAAVAAFRQAGSRQQAYQQGRQASQNVQDLLAKAQSSINPQLLPDVVAERQLKQQQQKQLLQQQRQQEELARRAGDSLYEEAKLGPFGPAVAKANALRKQMRQPLQRVEGEGHSLAICGFNTRERVVFLTTLMSFGPPFVHPTIEQGWAAFDKAFKGSKDRLQLSSYLMVFLEHLDDCAKQPNSTHGRSDFIPHNVFFWNNKVNLTPRFIWDRIATLHLLSIKLAESAKQPPHVRMCSDETKLYSNLSNRPMGWSAAQDKALILGIFAAGYDNWGKVIRIEELGLKTPLRIELELPTDYDNPKLLKQALDAVGGDAAAASNIKRQFQEKVNQLSRKERGWVERRVRHVVSALMHDVAPRAAAAEQRIQAEEMKARMQQQQQGNERVQKLAAPPAGRDQAQLPQAPSGGDLQRVGSGGMVFQQRPPHQQQQQQNPRAQQQQQQQQGGLPGVTSEKRIHWAAAVQASYDALKLKLANIRGEAQHVKAGDCDAVAAAGHKFRTSVRELQLQAKQMEGLLGTLHARVVQRKGKRAAGVAAGAPAAAAAAAPNRHVPSAGNLPVMGARPQQQQQQQQQPGLGMPVGAGGSQPQLQPRALPMQQQAQQLGLHQPGLPMPPPQQQQQQQQVPPGWAPAGSPLQPVGLAGQVPPAAAAAGGGGGVRPPGAFVHMVNAGLIPPAPAPTQAAAPRQQQLEVINLLEDD